MRYLLLRENLYELNFIASFNIILIAFILTLKMIESWRNVFIHLYYFTISLPLFGYVHVLYIRFQFDISI